MSVEVAHAVGDANIPRPWSKHSKGSSAFERCRSSVQCSVHSSDVTRRNQDNEEQEQEHQKPRTAREAKKQVCVARGESES